jgi:hypothetical protein
LFRTSGGQLLWHWPAGYDETISIEEDAGQASTVFIIAHIGMMINLGPGHGCWTSTFNANFDVSRPEVGRQPRTAREFLIKYQDRIFFGTDGGAGRMTDLDGFWRPHWRFFETYDEYFDHPAQLLSPEGAALHGRWKIYGVSLPDEVIRKIYYQNALRYFPQAQAAMKNTWRLGL